MTPDQLTGRDESGLVEVAPGRSMLPEAARALARLQQRAAAAGFELAVASAFRSFARQCAIWNGKASGQRPLHDDTGKMLDCADLSVEQRLHAILRFSALPGASRHHWGTDLDVYDAAAVDSSYAVQLTPEEVAPGGVFDAFHCWLDDLMLRDDAEGFQRPYNTDRGGVACERWHLSYVPLARGFEQALSPQQVVAAWDTLSEPLALECELREQIEPLFQRYVALPRDWCPRSEPWP